MATDLTTTMNALLECVQTALAGDDVERPVCSAGLTVGLPALGPQGCCDNCNNGAGGNASVHLETLNPVNGKDFEPVRVLNNCRGVAWAATVSVVVVRCYPAMNEQGVMPSLDETTPFAVDLNTDLSAAVNALLCCTGYDLAIEEAAVDADPEGGCSGFAVRLAVLVKP